jgi:hypothetical protein
MDGVWARVLKRTRRRKGVGLAPWLLVVNKEIYYQCLGILYSNHFFLHSQSALHDFAVGIGLLAASCLKKITFYQCFPNIYWPSSLVRGAGAFYSTCSSLLEEVNRVRGVEAAVDILQLPLRPPTGNQRYKNITIGGRGIMGGFKAELRKLLEKSTTPVQALPAKRDRHLSDGSADSQGRSFDLRRVSLARRPSEAPI